MNLLGQINVHGKLWVEKLLTTQDENYYSYTYWSAYFAFTKNSCLSLENKFACWETNCRNVVISALSGRFSQQSLSLLIITSKLQPSLTTIKKQIWHLRLLQVSSLLVTSIAEKQRKKHQRSHTEKKTGVFYKAKTHKALLSHLSKSTTETQGQSD